jgi:nucleotide-binding universal stress UspA family protein
MFHRVLVATGGSPWSDNAVKYAIGLAKDYHLEVVILHVLTLNRNASVLRRRSWYFTG